MYKKKSLNDKSRSKGTKNMNTAAALRRGTERTDPKGIERTDRTERRGVSINLRATETWRALIDRAASLVEKTRTDFIIEATRRQAEDVLLDQKFFELDEARYRDFMNVLDAPPPPNEALVRLMNKKAPWHK